MYPENPERARQLFDFSGLQEGERIPTDIDGFYECRKEKVMIFYEFKYHEKPMSRGQQLALEELVDTINKGNKYAIAFLCSHSVDDPEEVVDAAETIVKGIYFKDKWIPGNGITCKEATETFLRWAAKRGNKGKVG